MKTLLKKVNVPEGQSGDWKVEKFVVSDEDAKFDSLRAAVSGRGRSTPAGEYTMLKNGGVLVMSDTPDEMNDHYDAVREAKGDILINGLGLGMVLFSAMEKFDDYDVYLVRHATVIEKSEDVINLVGPYYKEMYGDKIKIIHADALEWKPPKGVRYQMVWHDIWNYICQDNLPEMHKLHRKYGRRCDWQGSWCRERLEYDKRRGAW